MVCEPEPIPVMLILRLSLSTTVSCLCGVARSTMLVAKRSFVHTLASLSPGGVVVGARQGRATTFDLSSPPRGVVMCIFHPPIMKTSSVSVKEVNEGVFCVPFSSSWLADVSSSDMYPFFTPFSYSIYCSSLHIFLIVTLWAALIRPRSWNVG